MASPSATPVAANSGSDCFFARSVHRYSILDDHHVRLHINPANEYVATTDLDTRRLDWSHALSIRPFDRQLCVGRQVGVELFGGEPAQGYAVTEIQRLPHDAPEGS